MVLDEESDITSNDSGLNNSIGKSSPSNFSLDNSMMSLESSSEKKEMNSRRSSSLGTNMSSNDKLNERRSNLRRKSNIDNDKENTDNQGARKKLSVSHSKPKKGLIEIKNKKKPTKRKSASTKESGKDEEETIRSSRNKKNVKYFEESDDSESDSEDEKSSIDDNESEDENRIVVKKKVQSKAPIFKKAELSEYEQMVERNKEANRKMLEAMGIMEAKDDLGMKAVKEKKEKKIYSSLRGPGRPKGSRGHKKIMPTQISSTHGMKKRTNCYYTGQYQHKLLLYRPVPAEESRRHQKIMPTQIPSTHGMKKRTNCYYTGQYQPVIVLSSDDSF